MRNGNQLSVGVGTKGTDQVTTSNMSMYRGMACMLPLGPPMQTDAPTMGGVTTMGASTRANDHRSTRDAGTEIPE